MYLVINAVIVLRGSSLATLTLPTGIVVMTFNNYFVGTIGTDYSSTFAWSATIVYCSIHFLLCQPKVFEIMMHQDRRWWLTPIRKQVAVMALVSPLRGPAFTTRTFDLSEEGAFVPVPKMSNYLDERVSLCLTLDNSSQIHCEANIVRFNAKQGRYPVGFGMKFEDIGFWQKRMLKKYLNQHPAQG